MSRTVNKADVAQQPVPASASRSLAWRINFLFALETSVTRRPRALFIVALVDLCIGVPELDGNVPFQFVFEPDCLYSRYGLDDSGLPVGDMPDRADVDCSLP